MSGKFQTIEDFYCFQKSQILPTNENSKSQTSPIVRGGWGQIWRIGRVSIFLKFLRFCDGRRSLPIKENSICTVGLPSETSTIDFGHYWVLQIAGLQSHYHTFVYKFQFLAHFPFLAKFNFGKIWNRLCGDYLIYRQNARRSAKSESVIVRDFPDIWKPRLYFVVSTCAVIGQLEKPRSVTYSKDFELGQ